MKKSLKTLTTLAASSVAAFAVAGASEAATISFEFDNATFFETTPGTLSGSFVYDTISMTYSNFNITSGPGSTVTSGFTYDTMSATVASESSTSFGLESNIDTGAPFFLPQWEFSVVFDGDLSSATMIGDEIDILLDTGSQETNNLPGVAGNQQRFLAGGLIRVTDFTPDPDPDPTTPEPATLLGLAAFGIAGLASRRLKK